MPVDRAIAQGTLPNGLRYYVRANRKPEHRAELRLAVKAGSILEEDDQQGLAHFVEHMAFNGTSHFPKHDVVAFLESLGMRFGADVNARTGFDDTVYMLTVPTDKPDVLDRALLILEDWAHDVSFEPEEIDKERGVVMEEWRLRRGAGARVSIGAADPAQGLALCRPRADRQDRRHSELQGGPSEEVLRRLVPPEPDGGGRCRRLRPGPGRRPGEAALRATGQPARRPGANRLRRTRSIGHHRLGHHRQGVDDHQRRGRLPRADPAVRDGRRLPPENDRPAVRVDALGAAG